MEELHEIDESAVEAVDSVENGLTGIPKSIHWPATHISGGSDTHELDRIAIEAFLDTLADVALAIAARECSETTDQERNEQPHECCYLHSSLRPIAGGWLLACRTGTTHS